MPDSSLFNSFFMAGFECSSHRRKDGVRLDLIRATGHDKHALGDYRRCANLGIRTIRDGVRWHLIETSPGVYDWSSWQPMLDAAERAGVQVMWDIFHYGSPDYLDQLSPEFIDAYARFAAAAVKFHRERTGRAPIVCPVNEISFFAWAIDEGYFPARYKPKLGVAKRQLVKAAIAGIDAMRAVEPDVKLVWAEPLIHVAPRDHSRAEKKRAEQFRVSQYEAYDMLIGRTEPELGGRPDIVEHIGLNFYPHNQWYYHGSTVPMGHHEYRPLSDMLVEIAERYERPILMAETGSENSGRPAWFHYVCDEVREAMTRGARIEGICLYPVTAYPGWDNSRHAEVGLFSTPLARGERRLFAPLAAELDRQRGLFETFAEKRGTKT